MVANLSPSGQHSLLVDAEHALAVASCLRDAAGLSNYCSNVTGVDWPAKEISEKVKVKKIVGGMETEVEEVRKTAIPGYLEAVYHLFSMEEKLGPLPLRMRTHDRESGVHLPSLTPSGAALNCRSGRSSTSLESSSTGIPICGDC